MQLNLKSELLIRIFCLVVLGILITMVYLNGKGLDCNKCEIKFNSENKQSNIKTNLSVNILDLFQEFKNGSCLVKFENGFYITKSK